MESPDSGDHGVFHVLDLALSGFCEQLAHGFHEIQAATARPAGRRRLTTARIERQLPL